MFSHCERSLWNCIFNIITLIGQCNVGDFNGAASAADRIDCANELSFFDCMHVDGAILFQAKEK